MHGKSFSERFRSKPENAAKAAARAAARTIPRVNRSDCYYVKLHIAHLVELIEMNDPAAFMLFNLTGAIGWVVLCTAAGYLFGNIPAVRNNFSLVTIGIVIVSLLPMAVELMRHRRRRPAA